MDLSPDPNKNLKYPKSVWFIVLNELCERFNYYGLRTVLVLYLTTVLRFDGDKSTIIYHTFVFMAYFMPLPGAILADSYWGKFNTIIRLSIVYVLGNVILTGASAANSFSLHVQRAVALLGLFLISVGTGGIKPCVFTFGGDQFRVPEQERQLSHYTTKFFIAINVGSLVSTFLTPELRHSVHCFGRDTCFPLAFGVPAALMLTAIVIFISGKNIYTRKKPEYNVISRTFGCIFYALRTKISSSVPCQTHWLDNAKGVYSETEIMETKTSLKAISVFMAYPVFWALYELQGSRWTLQATLMNGRVDFLDWTIKPDQMQTIIPFFGLLLLFLFDVTFYPLLAKVGIRNPLQKFTLSGLLAVVAFVIAALLEIKIFGNSTVILPGEGSVNIYNGFDCKVSVRSPSLLVDHIDPLQMINVRHTNMSQEEYVVGIKFEFNSECSLLPDDIQFNTTLSVIKGREVSYYLTRLNPNTVMLNRIGDYDTLKKEKFGNPKLRFLTDGTFNSNDNITLNDADNNSLNSYYFSSLRETNFTVLQTGKYSVLLNGPTQLATVDLTPATFYTLMLQRNGEKMDVKLFAADEGNYIHILWQVPQFLCMIIADVIFVVTSTEFSFTEAPINMKSFIMAISLLTTAVGNLLVVIISAMSIQNQAHEYLLYAGLMFGDTLLFVYFNHIYRGKKPEKKDARDDKHEKHEENLTTPF